MSKLSLTFDPEQITRASYDNMADQYSRHTIGSRMRPAIQEALKLSATMMRPGGRVLILGSGDGRDAAHFEDLGFQPVCLDFSHAMNVLALKGHGLQLVTTGNMRRLPFGPLTFDGVWASMCMYHLPRTLMKSCLRAIRAVLRPGGAFYLNLRPGEGEKLELTPASFPTGGPRYYTFYSERQLRALIKDFEVIRLCAIHPQLGNYLIQAWLRVPTSEVL